MQKTNLTSSFLARFNQWAVSLVHCPKSSAIPPAHQNSIMLEQILNHNHKIFFIEYDEEFTKNLFFSHLLKIAQKENYPFLCIADASVEYFPSLGKHLYENAWLFNSFALAKSLALLHAIIQHFPRFILVIIDPLAKDHSLKWQDFFWRQKILNTKTEQRIFILSDSYFAPLQEIYYKRFRYSAYFQLTNNCLQ